MKKTLFLLLAVIMMTTSLTACGTKQQSTTVTTTPAPQKITLTASSSMVGESRVNAMNATIKIYNETHPNVIINYTPFNGPDYPQHLQLGFGSGQGDDLVLVDDLNQQTVQKYLMDITEDIKARKWLDKQLPGSVEFNNIRTPGKLYSVPFTMGPVAVYYNKPIFEKLGITPPKTLDEFDQACAKIKAAGYIPMENGGLQNYMYLWTLYHLVMGTAPMEDVQKWYYAKETTPVFEKAFVDSLKVMEDYGKKGYYRPNSMAIDYKTTPSLYAAGKSAMLVDGDWELPNIEKANIPTGVFIFPRKDQNLPPTIVNATDSAWALNANLSPEKKQAALDFIDIFMNPRDVKIWVEAGMTPSIKYDSSKDNISPLRKEFNKAMEGTNMGFYLDNTAPGFLDVIKKQSQMLLMGQVDAEKVWENLKAEYTKLQAENKK